MRAIPEKTLEHWSSMYLARRFPDCQLWWPSVDEDITVQTLSSRMGKSLLLEVKTTDWNWQRGEHRLTIDVDQLARYQGSPVPVYYLLPMPPWREVLTDGHAWLNGRARSELVSPGHGWFGHWVFVTHARTLWAWLGNRRAQKSATLFASSGGITDLSRVGPPLAPWWRWPDFWDGMANCGTPDMPAIFSCPMGARPSGPSRMVTREILLQRLRASFDEFQVWQSDAGVERFTHVEDDLYRPLDQLDLLELPLTSGATGRSTALVHLSASDLTI